MPKKKKAYFRIIGDVHGKYDKFCKIATEAEYSLQVGDMGFDYRYLERVLDETHHRMIGGNHDNYTRKICEACPGKECAHCKGKGFVYCYMSKHFLGDFGLWNPPEFEPIFYVRGAWSIDVAYRMPGISWWENEELTYAECQEAIDFYTQIKPDFMVTHTAPDSIVESIPFERLFGSELHHPRTEKMLDAMYDVHQPKIWLFGHWHVAWDKVLKHPKTGKETRFICLPELGYKDFPKLGEEVDGNK